MSQINTAVKDLPNEGIFSHVKSYLSKERVRSIDIHFVEKVTSLGCTYHDNHRQDVVAFDSSGICGGFRGSYGGSNAMLFRQDLSAVAAAGKVESSLPPGKAILQVTLYGNGKRYFKLSMNPIHRNPNILPPPISLREKAILSCWGYKSSYRPEALAREKVEQKELDSLVERGYIKPRKDAPIVVKKVWASWLDEYRYSYKLNGARITPSGKTAAYNR